MSQLVPCYFNQVVLIFFVIAILVFLYVLFKYLWPKIYHLSRTPLFINNLKALLFSLSISLLVVIGLKVPFKILSGDLGLGFIYPYIAFVFIFITLFIKSHCNGKEITNREMVYAIIFFILAIILDYFDFYPIMFLFMFDCLNTLSICYSSFIEWFSSLIGQLKDQIVYAYNFLVEHKDYAIGPLMLNIFTDKVSLPMGVGPHYYEPKPKAWREINTSNSLNMEGSNDNNSGSNNDNGEGSSTGVTKTNSSQSSLIKRKFNNDNEVDNVLGKSRVKLSLSVNESLSKDKATANNSPNWSSFIHSPYLNSPSPKIGKDQPLPPFMGKGKTRMLSMDQATELALKYRTTLSPTVNANPSPSVDSNPSPLVNANPSQTVDLTLSPAVNTSPSANDVTSPSTTESSSSTDEGSVISIEDGTESFVLVKFLTPKEFRNNFTNVRFFERLIKVFDAQTSIHNNNGPNDYFNGTSDKVLIDHWKIEDLVECYNYHPDKYKALLFKTFNSMLDLRKSKTSIVHQAVVEYYNISDEAYLKFFSLNRLKKIYGLDGSFVHQLKEGVAQIIHAWLNDPGLNGGSIKAMNLYLKDVIEKHNADNGYDGIYGVETRFVIPKQLTRLETIYMLELLAQFYHHNPDLTIEEYGVSSGTFATWIGKLNLAKNKVDSI